MALNATDVPVTGTSIEIDLTTIILQVVITVAVSVGVGTLLGYYMSERSRTKQEQLDIQKIKDLLKEDFERINILYKNDVETILESIHSVEGDPNLFEKLVLDRTEISSFLLKNSPYYEFNYWEMILHSSLMVKLKTNDIENLQADHNLIEKLSKAANDFFADSKDLCKKIRDSSDDFEIRKLRLKYTLLVRLHGFLDVVINLYMVSTKSDVAWISKYPLKKEIYDEAKNRRRNYRELMSQGKIEFV